MINTYQTGVPPPPIPPRLSRSGTILVPAPASSSGHSKSLLRFLVGVVLLHLLLSLGGIIYMYHTGRLDRVPTVAGKTALLSAGNTPYITMARMIVKQPSHKQPEKPGYLQWNIDHSVRRNVNYYLSSWLTVWQPGDYYVYSRVTFSKRSPRIPLVSWVKMRESETGEEKVVMKAYCSIQSDNSGMCTATQGEVMTLEAGSQLSVWVQDLSCVDYEEEATSFGMYKL